MYKETIKLLKEFKNQQITFKDMLGTHKGIIKTLQIQDNGIMAYCLFFGQNLWLRYNEVDETWEEFDK